MTYVLVNIIMKVLMGKNKMLHTVAHVQKSKLSEAEIEAGIVRGVIGSSEVLDRAGDIIRQDGWDLKNFMKNRVVLWGHNVRQDRPPIGKAVKVWLDGKTYKTKKLMFDIQFDLKDDFAAEIYRKVLDGFVNTVSVGFIPLEREDNVYTKNELLELSFVPVPANPEAVVTLRSAGFDPVELKDLYKAKSDADVDTILESSGEEKEETAVEDEDITNGSADEETSENDGVEQPTTDEVSEVVEDELETEVNETEEAVEEEKEGEIEEEPKKDEEEKEEEDVVVEPTKGVVPFSALDTAPESEEWDGQGEVAKAEVANLLELCAWHDSDNLEAKSSYLLIHHRASDKKAVWRGVVMAMASLLGAKGGIELPETDRKAVYDHLAKHYEEFKKTAPDYALVEERVLSKLAEEVHVLTLDREEKYAVRLVKKLLKEIKRK